MYMLKEEENLSKNIIKLLFMQSIDISFPSDFFFSQSYFIESGMTFYAMRKIIQFYKSFHDHDEGMLD